MATVLPAAMLDVAAEAGDAAAPVEALAFLEAARRFAVLVAEEGVPEPDVTAAAEKRRMIRKGTPEQPETIPAAAAWAAACLL